MNSKKTHVASGLTAEKLASYFGIKEVFQSCDEVDLIQWQLSKVEAHILLQEKHPPYTSTK